MKAPNVLVSATGDVFPVGCVAWTFHGSVFLEDCSLDMTTAVHPELATVLFLMMWTDFFHSQHRGGEVGLSLPVAHHKLTNSTTGLMVVSSGLWYIDLRYAIMLRGSKDKIISNVIKY